MDAGTVWVKSNHNGDFKARASVGEDEVVEQIFRMERIEHGVVKSSGYTEVRKDTYDALIKGSKIFAEYVKDKTVIVYDEAPDDAISPMQKIASLTNQLNAANAEIASLKEGNSSKEITDLTAEVDDLTAQLKAANESNDDLTAQLKAANDTVASLTETAKISTSEFKDKAPDGTIDSGEK